MRVADIRIYPVKGCRGRSFDEAFVEPCGLSGDRRWMVVDPAGKFITQRTHPRMALVKASATGTGLLIEAPGQAALEVAFPPADAQTLDVTVWRDTVPARVAAPEAAALLATAIGEACRLVWLHDPSVRTTDPAYAPAGSTVNFADSFPLLLASSSSLDVLNGWLPSPIPIARFRPNLVVEGAWAWDEDCWRRIRIGEVVFLVAKPCERCIVTTIDQETGERPDKTEPLRTLGRYRKDASGGVMFGQNLVPETVGTVRIGDALEVLEMGVSNVRLEAVA